MKHRRTWWIAGTALVLMLVFLTSLSAQVSNVAQAQQEQQTADAACTTNTDALAVQVHAALAHHATDAQVEELPHPKRQLPNARVIVATGIGMHVPARGQVIALATALQESGLRNLPGGDRDSIGLFQQRPSQGWGTPAQLRDPLYAATRFYQALLSVPRWQQLPVTVAAQKVQKSAYPNAYARHEQLATALQRALAPTLGSAAVPQNVVQSGSNSPCTQVSAATDPGKIPPSYTIPPNAPLQVRTAITWALKQLGTPYQWGGSCTNPHGSTPAGHCDCSSLVQRAYGVAGVTLPRTTYDQVHQGSPVPAKAPRAGDLLFTRGSVSHPEHVLMAIGHGLAVQAPAPGDVVKVSKITDQGSLLAVRRLVDSHS